MLAEAGASTDLEGGTATLRYAWKAEGEGTLLGMALPHQMDTLQVHACTDPNPNPNPNPNPILSPNPNPIPHPDPNPNPNPNPNRNAVD